MKTLADTACRRLRRRKMHRKKTSRKSRAAARSAPSTMPTIAPTERPDVPVPPAPTAAAGVAVADDAPVVVVLEEVKRGERPEVVGRRTPAQRDSTLAPTQHESVAFGELAAQ